VLFNRVLDLSRDAFTYNVFVCLSKRLKAYKRGTVE